MNVGDWTDVFTKVADVGGKKIAEGSIADSLIKGGTALVQAHSQLKIAKIQHKGQKIDPNFMPVPAGRQVQMQEETFNPGDLLGKNGGLILGGIGVLGAILFAIKLTGKKPARGR